MYILILSFDMYILMLLLFYYPMLLDVSFSSVEYNSENFFHWKRDHLNTF